MNHKIISVTLVGIGFLLGATALSALAAWTAPSVPDTTAGETAPCTPPKCNIAAPINVGSVNQIKTGSLQVNSSLVDTWGLIVNNKIKIIDATAVAAGANNMVLKSDANGVGSWQSINNYAFSVIPGYDNYGTAYACRINTLTGVVDCKQRGGGQVWASTNSPFAMSTGNGRYTLSCATGSTNYNATMCCRGDELAGTLSCMTKTQGAATWYSDPNTVTAF